MCVAVDLLSGIVECLLLVLALDAARRGRRLYWAAVAGMALVLYARMADGFIGITTILTVMGLLLAGLTVVADLLFEVVEDTETEADPSL